MNNFNIPPEYPCKYPDIEHNFVFTGNVLTSYPAQYPEICRNCGLTRVGTTSTTYWYSKK